MAGFCRGTDGSFAHLDPGAHFTHRLSGRDNFIEIASHRRTTAAMWRIRSPFSALKPQAAGTNFFCLGRGIDGFWHVWRLETGSDGYGHCTLKTSVWG